MVIRRTKQNQISFGYCDTTSGQRVYPTPPIDPTADLLPEQVPPEPEIQDPGQPDVKDDAMKITCSPPLAQATAVPEDSDSVRFHVLVQHHSPGTSAPEIVLWHNHNGEHDWSELPLKQLTTPSAALFAGDSATHDTPRHRYAASLQGLPKHGHAVSFTLKYRLAYANDWQWIKDTTGLHDGSLYYSASTAFMKYSSSYTLDHFLDDISADIKVEQVEPETTKTQLWSLECPVSAAKGQDSGCAHHRLGKVKKSQKWFALVRLWSPWLAPRQGTADSFELDKDAVLLSFLRSDGLHVVCLAISGVEDVLSTFIHGHGGMIEVKGRNDRKETGTSRVLVAVAEEFERANAAVMYHARKLVTEFSSASERTADSDQIKTLSDEVKPEWLEEWYDGLTYCTWNGLGQKLTAEKIYTALDELSKQDINITNLIIDDNWQSLSTGETQFKRGWSRFEANSEGFPDGLKTTTRTLRDRHPNLNHIAVWHAILGYWGGIDPDGEIAKTYKTRIVDKEPGVAGGTFTVVDPSDAKQMYNDFYAFLSASGIDAVKTDAQFFLDLLLHAPDRREMIREYQDAWTLAHLRHFSSRAISCMSQFPQALFHSQLPHNKPRLLVRNSDDFFPEVEASHAWHIFCNAHNSVFTQHLNALPDWDMFQTSHDWASFHAAARAVSGGPIYFTDKPGQHDIGLIRQMTAQTIRGKTVILRPHVVGKALSVYDAYGAQAILKVGTFVGGAGKGASITGCFNVSRGTLRELITLVSFQGTEKGEYVVGSFCSGTFSEAMAREQDDAMVHLSLDVRGWDILTASPAHPFTLHGKEIRVAMLGLLGKMTGVAAVTNYDMYIEENGRLRVWTSLKALGVMGLWISDLKEKTVGDNFMVVIFGKPIPVHCVTKRDVGKKSSGVLEVDVERAWKEMDLKPGWSNEVSLEVFVS